MKLLTIEGHLDNMRSTTPVNKQSHLSGITSETLYSAGVSNLRIGTNFPKVSKHVEL